MNTQPTHDSVAMPDPSEVDTAYVEEVGALVFESALMQYFAEANEAQVAIFEAFITEQAASETFMSDLCAQFPEFEKLLLQEMEALSEDFGSVFPTSADVS